MLAAIYLGGVVLGAVLWGWEGVLYISLIVVVSLISSVISGKIRKKQDKESERKYGGFGETRDNRSPSKSTRDSSAYVDGPTSDEDPKAY